jgi:hypothetical protein
MIREQLRDLVLDFWRRVVARLRGGAAQAEPVAGDGAAETGSSVSTLQVGSFRRLLATARRLGLQSNPELRHLVDLFSGVYERTDGAACSILVLSPEPLEALGVPPSALAEQHVDPGELDQLARRTEPLSTSETLRLSWHLVRTCWPCYRLRIARIQAGIAGKAPDGADPLIRVLTTRPLGDPRALIREVLDETLRRSAPESALDRVFRTGLRILPPAAEQLHGSALAELLALFHLAVARASIRTAEAQPVESAGRRELLSQAWEEAEIGVGWLNRGRSGSPELRSRGFECFAEVFRASGEWTRAFEALRQAARAVRGRRRFPSEREIELLCRLGRWQAEGDPAEAVRTFQECRRLIEQRGGRTAEALKSQVRAGLSSVEPTETMKRPMVV